MSTKNIIWTGVIIIVLLFVVIFLQGGSDNLNPYSENTGNETTNEEEATGVDAVVVKVKALAISASGAKANEVSVVSTEEVEWPNSCLGAGSTDDVCAQVITAGYKVILKVSGAEYTYHTDQTGDNVRFKGISSPTEN